ncbi:MAG TPA: sugar ABC transporter ATP-binding protein [Epulopiscium sp.]|nr:sugar ABC transporter ATP-binding protein [Candidatus Epulonipiscium sp.]
MKNPILKLINITKAFDEDFILNHINLSLFASEVHVLVGENGSGKSAIMNIIAGIIKQDSGDIFINQKLVNIDCLSSSKNHDILYLMQDINCFGNLTVAENVFSDKLPFTNKYVKIIDYNKLYFKCQALFDELNIPINIREKADKLGLAEKYLIEFARAYISDSKIIIFDEPTAVLTKIERDILFSIIQSLKQKGVGIFYISHRIEEIKLIGDRVTFLRKGNVLGTRDLAHIESSEILKILTGSIHKNKYPKLDIPLGTEVLSVNNLHWGTTLRNITFNLRKNEIIGITGLMGSGRTKLAHCLFGATKPTAGTITINKKEVILNSPSDAIAHGIALVPEDRTTDSIFGDLDVITNLSISSLKRFTRFGKLHVPMVERITKDYVNRLNISHSFSYDPLASYSGGNQQKVVLAKWIMSRSKIFIFDEPTRGIDIVSKVDIYNSLTDLVTKGASIILISSDIDELLGMCDRIMILSNGQIVRELSRSEATKEKVLHYVAQAL